MNQGLRVWVDFESGGDPIAGNVRTTWGGQAFTGWLELISGLEHALREWREPGASGQGAEPLASGPHPERPVSQS